ncbi:MAG TPA: 4-oxalocrotonate decarboxylase [Myxococcales bacterium LLY-WYZ-16_1]|nr:4-oxalocrotonate decarboxylase [Myxococcales bacterium LLY-WYZ-16_1]
MSVDVDRWSDYLLDAVESRRAVRAITKQADLSLEEAYAIQEAAIDKRIGRGEKRIGAKLGLTSKAKQRQMGVEEPVYGWLTDRMQLPVEEPLRLAELIHPRCEPELVFHLNEDLAGPGVTAHDVLQATRAVTGGIEVIDSRYEAFSFTLPDVVADNTSAARFVLGANRIGPTDADLALLGCLFEVNGELVDTAAGAALLGHPAASVARLANHLGQRNQKLEAGWVVLAGGLTSAQHLQPGTHVAVRYAHLGRVGLKAVES